MTAGTINTARIGPLWFNVYRLGSTHWIGSGSNSASDAEEAAVRFRWWTGARCLYRIRATPKNSAANSAPPAVR